MANESFGIMNDRLGSALQDNANNHNADSRVNGAYNDAKHAIGGSMDTSHATSVTGTASSATISGYGQAYTAAKNEVNQAAGGFGQSYIDAKNTSSGYVKNDPTGSPVAQTSSVNPRHTV
ncbi:hypothetical protein FD733_00520 [Pantoea sp. Eser]|nr:hypothetical protein [Pantoea sp. Eser]